MPTFAETAARITCMACATATGKVKITSFEPFRVSPGNLLDKAFQDVAINDQARIDVFKQAAAELMPDRSLKPKVLAQAVDKKKRIMLFAHFLEGLLAAADVRGGR